MQFTVKCDSPNPKETPAQLARVALIYVESVYDCCLMLTDAIDNLETLETEHGRQERKVLRRSKALLEFISATLDNSTKELRWLMRSLVDQGGEMPDAVTPPRFSLFQTVWLKDLRRNREIELCGLYWNYDPTAGKIGWFYCYGDGSSSVHESGLDEVKNPQ